MDRCEGSVGVSQGSEWRCRPSVSVSQVSVYKWHSRGRVQVAVSQSAKGQCTGERVYSGVVYIGQCRCQQWQSQPSGSVLGSVAVSAKWQCTGGIVQVAVRVSSKGQCTGGSVQVVESAKQ